MTERADDTLKTSPTFGRIWSAVLLTFAAVNACSYYVLTDYPWRRLTLETQGVLVESSAMRLGFPAVIEFRPALGITAWDQWNALASNIICAVCVATCYGWFYGTKQEPQQDSSQMLPYGTDGKRRFDWQIRFRLVHLFAITTITAVLLGLFAQAPDQTLRAVKLLYIGGPCIIVWCFYVLRQRPRLQTVGTLSITAVLVIMTSTFASRRLGDFTFGLFGLFVCWLPQLLAIALLALILQNLRASWQSLEN